MDPLFRKNYLKGKIARLPGHIRDQVSQRLYDGQTGPVLLPWLNSLPEVKEMVANAFDGKEVERNNLAVWRNAGYQDWLRRRERIERTKELSRYAAEVSRAQGASIAKGAVSIASGKLLEVLETVDDAAAEQADGQKLDVKALVAIAGAINSLRASEQNDIRLKQNKKRLGQTDERLALEREKYQRDTAALALQALADERMKAIEASDVPDPEKMDRIGRLLFPETWDDPGDDPGDEATPDAQ